ncbi:phage head spike fiber domain-containing protein [Vibrio metschnikovii]
MDWIYLNVSVQNNSKVVTVHNQSTAGVRAGDGLLIPGFGLVQVSGVFSGQLELKQPWTNASQQSAQAAIVPTFGDFEGAAKTMRDFTQTTQANFAEMEKWFTQTGTVKFKGQNNIEHTVRTAKQMDADVKAIEQSGNEKLAVLEQRAEHVYDEVSEAMMTEFNRRKALRESIKQKATLSLDFVNNEHKIYGPLGLETKPLTDILVTERATAGTYQSPFGLSVASPNVPRIQYDPVSGENLGLLIERRARNLAMQSEQFSDPVWQRSNVLIEADSHISPDGSFTADKYIPLDVNSNYLRPADIAPEEVVMGDIYAWSVFAKAGEVSAFRMMSFLATGGTGGSGITVDLITGEVTPVGTQAGINYKIEKSRFGYWRVALFITVQSSNQRLVTQISTRNGPADNSKDGFFIWGAQLENGGLTSYIKTGVSSGLRSDDRCFIPDLMNLVKSTEFTLKIETGLIESPVLLFNASGASISIGFRLDFINVGVILAKDGGSYASVTIPADKRAGGTYAISVTKNRLALAVNGEFIGSRGYDDLDLSDLVNSSLGRRLWGDSGYVNSTIKSVFASAVALSDEELAEVSR